MVTYPKFRPDVEVFEQADSVGRTVIVLKDPISQQYFRLSEYEYRFLRTLDGTLTAEEAADKLRTKGYYYAPEDVTQIMARAAQAGLLLGTAFGTARFQLALKGRREEWKKGQRLSSIYFLFIPLFNPDRFLDRTLPLFNALWNRWTALLAALALPGTLYLIISGLPRIHNEILFFFSAGNLVYLWLTIALTKLAHELAHAYSAKKFGLHVPQMGVAFLIFFPCLYCNTTEAWQLADRKQRMTIGAAGVLVEAVLAVVATYVWYFSKPGIANSLALYVMGVSFASTVFVNGNPLLRFDGYFVLSDYLRIPNLYQKAFSYLRYLFWNGVLGVSDAADPALSGKERLAFATYGVSALAYRIFLYGAIVSGVYYRFDKTLGIVLGGLAFGLFLVRPMLRGVHSVFKKRDVVRPRLVGSTILGAIVLGLIVLLLIPISGNSLFPCYVDSARKQKLTVPLHTWVGQVHIREGMPVRKGSVLFQLDTSVLKLNLQKKEADRNIIRNELELLMLDDQRRAEIPGKEIELYQAEDEIRRIQRQLADAEGGITAPFDGIVTRLNPKLKPGFEPGEGVIVGELESPSELTAHALIPERYLSEIHKGQHVRVWLPAHGGEEFHEIVQDIRPFSEKDLSESPFSSRFGGELATEARSQEQKDAPLEAQYDCLVMLNGAGGRMPLGMTGRLVVSSPPRSIASRVVDSALQTFRRESLF